MCNNYIYLFHEFPVFDARKYHKEMYEQYSGAYSAESAARVKRVKSNSQLCARGVISVVHLAQQ